MQIDLLDSHGKVVKRGVGSLDVTTEPGLYELEYNVGSNCGNQLLSLRPGATVEIFAQLDFPTSAPIGSATIDLAQQKALASMTSSPPTVLSGHGSGRLVVFLRPTAEIDERPEMALDAQTFNPFTLVTAGGEIVTNLEAHELRFDADSGYWAAASAKLDPGGYALRFHPPGRAFESGSRVPRRLFDQSVWIEDGWQTILFIPNTSFGPRPQSASVHMARVGEEWDPSSVTTLMLETMFVCLRDGRAVVPFDFLLHFKESVGGNPMLGIVGAHSALLSEASNFDVFDQTMDQLLKYWPKHPDVMALQWIGDERKVASALGKTVSSIGGNTRELEAPKRHVTPITWPPMLLLSYEGLLRADAKWESLDVIGDNSLAERAAAGLLVGGLWSAWQPVTNTKTEHTPVFRTQHLGVVGVSLNRLISAVLRLTGRPVTSREWQLAIAGWETPDPTSALLKEYLKQRAANTEAENVVDFIAKLNAPDISLATGLPVRGVQRVLADIKKLFELERPRKSDTSQGESPGHVILHPA